MSSLELVDILVKESTTMFEMYNDKSGYWRWRYRARNGRVLADSGEAYHNKSDCESAINILKRDAPAAPII